MFNFLFRKFIHYNCWKRLTIFLYTLIERRPSTGRDVETKFARSDDEITQTPKTSRTGPTLDVKRPTEIYLGIGLH